jgi:hypothetical protein
MIHHIIAQVQSIDLQAVLFAYGPMGVMLAWFMLRGEKLIKEVRDFGHKIDGLRLALLANTISNANTPEALRRFCDAEIARMNASRRNEKDE